MVTIPKETKSRPVPHAERPITRLIQHDYVDDPWKVLVCCLLLNRTGGQQVRNVLQQFFAKYPTPEAMLAADPAQLVEVIKPLGLYNRRAKLLKEFSQDYIDKEWTDPRELKGIGEYGWEAWRILMEDKTDFTPTDSVLRRYLAWLATQPAHSRLAADLAAVSRPARTR